MFYYVLEDRNGKYRPGSQLEGAEARVAASQGVALIPVEPSLYQVSSAMAGFFRTDFGNKGWQLPVTSGPIAPMCLFVAQKNSIIHWRACVEFANANAAYGQLRLTTDSAQFGMKVGIQSEAVELSQYKDMHGPVVIGGQSVLSAPPSGMLGLALWGTGGGKLLWAAVSQTLKPVGDYVVNPGQSRAEPLEYDHVEIPKGKFPTPKS